MMGTPSDVLAVRIYVSAKFRQLNGQSKYHHVIKCCPSCGTPLVLFREKFGEVQSSPTSGVKQRSPGLPGGWVCTKCGLHILPYERSSSQSGFTSPSERKTNPEKRKSQSPERTNTSRDNSPQRPHPHQSHPTSPQSPYKPDQSVTSPTSPKPPVIIDDDYEIWECHVRNSFSSFLTQIRDRLGQKEAALKQYQVTLCQRERQLRSNEEGMFHRFNKMKQSEQNFKTKMDRLNLYKESMINQLEAKARQLSHFEQQARSSSDLTKSGVEDGGSARDFSKSLYNMKGSSFVGRPNSNGTQDISIHSTMNNSGTSERMNSSHLSQSDTAKSPKSNSYTSNLDKHRPEYGSNMNNSDVKPYEEKPSRLTSPGTGDIRGSQVGLTRDFRPNGASSANINQIFTKRDPSNAYIKRAAGPVINDQHYTDRLAGNRTPPANRYRESAAERKWPPLQKASSPPAARKGIYNGHPPGYQNKPDHGSNLSPKNGSVSEMRINVQVTNPHADNMPLKSALRSPNNYMAAKTHRPHTVAVFVDDENNSPTDRERSTSVISDLSPTYTTSGYASDRDNSLNTSRRPAEKERHNVSFDDMISTSSPQNTVERDTRPPWMKRRSRRLTEV